MGQSVTEAIRIFALQQMRCVIAVIAAASACCGASGEPMARFEYSEAAMGGRARIVVYAPDESTASAACEAAFQRMAELEDITSDYRPSSELMRLCAGSGGPATVVSADLLNILVRCRGVSSRSQGAFDATVGPLVRLWRAARASGEFPHPDELAAARRKSGWRKVAINTDAGTVRLVEPGMLLDLGGIAKGFACDEALRTLRNADLAHALVEMGGDIAVGDPPPGEQGWRIKIAAASPCDKYLVAANAGVSTSGDTEQFVEIDGIRYSHVVDPRSGLGVTSRITVTVAASDAATSDALATAVCVLGEKEGIKLIGHYEGARLEWIGNADN